MEVVEAVAIAIPDFTQVNLNQDLLFLDIKSSFLLQIAQDNSQK